MELKKILLLLLIALSPSYLWADACNDVATCTPCTFGSGSDHTSHAGYVCTYTVQNEDHASWDDITKGLDKVWDEDDLNCSCTGMNWTFTDSTTRGTSNCASISGSYSASVSATAGVNLAGLTKAEATATATWTVGAGWSNTQNADRTLSCSTGMTIPACSDGHYEKFYHHGQVDGDADVFIQWTDDLTCWNAGEEIEHTGYVMETDAITAFAYGYKYVTDDSLYIHGRGFNPVAVSDVCTDCASGTPCYEGGTGCPDECPNCD